MDKSRETMVLPNPVEGKSCTPSNEEFYKFIVSEAYLLQISNFRPLSNQSGLATENVHSILNANKTFERYCVHVIPPPSPLWEHTYSGGKHMRKLTDKIYVRSKGMECHSYLYVKVYYFHRGYMGNY